MPVGESVSETTTTSGCGRARRSPSSPTPAARGPVSPSGSAKTRSPKCSAPARNAASVESAGRLPTSSSSLLTRPLMPEPSRLATAPRRSALDDPLREAVDALEAAVRRCEEVVADPAEEAAADVRRVAADAVILVDDDRLVGAHERALDHVVALAVAVQALLLRTPVAAQEGVVLGEHLAGRHAGSQQVDTETLRLDREGELLGELLRRGPDDATAPELGEHAARAVALDEHREDVALADDAVLEVGGRGRRRLARGRRRAQVDALLAAELLARMPRDRRDL